jgi:hypothetical protein
MARADKLAAVNKAALIIHLREFIDYSLVVRAHGCNYIAVSRRVYGLIKL